jgi:hypothetical protein
MQTAVHEKTEQRIELAARAAVLGSANWLTAFQVAELAKFSTSNPSKRVNEWKEKGAIFSIHDDGIEYYPSYSLDELKSYQPLEVIAGVLKIFGYTKSGWGLAYWFWSPNSYLGGKRPQDILAKDPVAVLNAARADTAGIQHG